MENTQIGIVPIDFTFFFVLRYLRNIIIKKKTITIEDQMYY